MENVLKSLIVSERKSLGKAGKATNAAYNKVTFTDDGFFELHGDVTLNIEEVVVSKNDTGSVPYEFKAMGNPGKDGDNSVNGEDGGNGENGSATAVKIEIKKLESSIHVVSAGGKGGDGGNGLNGHDGGDGGDAPQVDFYDNFPKGGIGGDGSNGRGKGGNGGDAGGCPVISVSSRNESNDARIEISFEYAEGGKKGLGGKGGKGGKGGRNGDGTNANKGQDGTDCDDGKPGKSGSALESFKQKLENYGRLYKLNLAIDVENEYYLESVGGEDNLKNFPSLYNAYTSAREAAVSQMQSNERHRDLPDDDSVKFDVYDMICKPALEGNDMSSARYYMAASFSGSFLDKSSNAVDATLPKKFSVRVKGKVYEPGSSRLPYMNVNKAFEQVNSVDSQFQSDSDYPNEEFWDRNLKFMFHVDVYDSEGKLNSYALNKGKGHIVPFGNPASSPIEDIVLEHPRSSHPDTNEIRILYGRTTQLEKADYTYATNNADANNGVLWTVVPIKGSITMKSISKSDNYHAFEKLTQPDPDDEDDLLGRSLLLYNGKEWIKFRNDLKDDDLYKLMTDASNNIFKVTMGTGTSKVETLHFDLLNPTYKNNSDRIYDWGHNFNKASTDNVQRICNLEGGFVYDLCLKDKNGKKIESELSTECSFIFKSIKPDELKKKGRDYYTFSPGSYVIYIPPLHLWWGCYARNTQIRLEDGTTKPAENIKPGDRLPCHGGKILTVDNIFTGDEQTLVQVKTDNGGIINVSFGHPMLQENGEGIPAEMLVPGNKIMLADGTLTEVTSVGTTCCDGGIVYNFSFEGENEGNYIVANDYYSGDFYAQNLLKMPEPTMTAQQQSVFDELKRLAATLE